jgi:hypothetical protein
MKNKKKNTLPIKREGEKYYSTMTGHGVIYDVGGGGGAMHGRHGPNGPKQLVDKKLWLGKQHTE